MQTIAVGTVKGGFVAQRGAAEAWKTATGSYPAGLDETHA